MEDIWIRFIENMGNRIDGPMKLRFILQPAMAAIFAIIAGLKDAKAGRIPYFWSLIYFPNSRTEMLKDGWKSVGKVFVIALVLDVIYQISVLHFVYPGEAIITAFMLAILPYLVIRGLTNRIARMK